jgi:hypothetical protein
MKLSAEQFAELASSFGALDSGRKPERRRAARMELHARVKITPIEAGGARTPIEVAICDFSPRGICFLHEFAMQSGEQFITQIPAKSGGSVWLLCTALHSKPVTPSLFKIGAEFTCTVQPPPADADAEEQVRRIRASMLS